MKYSRLVSFRSRLVSLTNGGYKASSFSRTIASTSRPVLLGNHPDMDKAPYVLPTHSIISCPPMVYISGEEMTRYCCELILEKWIKPHVDTSAWQYFDLSCISRDKVQATVGPKGASAVSLVSGLPRCNAANIKHAGRANICEERV